MSKILSTTIFSMIFSIIVAQPTKNSVLSDGNWIKISVQAQGIYKIDRAWFSANGINPTDINPNNIQLFGNGGQMLPENNTAPRVDDLRENAIYMSGAEDGAFGQNDYILFYAPGPDKWFYDEDHSTFRMQKNVYDTKAYYFLKLDGSNGLRITNSQSIPQTTNPSDQYLDFQRLEEDKVNLLGKDAVQQGSGKQWFGDELTNTREISYSNHFDFTDLVIENPAWVEAIFAGRSKSTSRYYLDIAEKTFSQSVYSTSLHYESIYARNSLIRESFTLTTPNPEVTVRYPQVATASQAWLDYIQINAWRKTNYRQKPLRIVNPESLDHDNWGFVFSNIDDNTLLWDITDFTRPADCTQDLQSKSAYNYTVDKLRLFYLFNPQLHSNTPAFEGKIENQNLHGVEDLDMLIIYHPDFKTEAEKLAQHRSQYTGLIVETANIFDIYNEFASGSPDPTAIRDFAKMLYDRSPTFRFLLLLGDGSYDYRHIMKETEYQNFVPTFQTDNSLDPIYAFPSDDYYALLSDGEGEDLKGALDIAVGRIPAKTATEAMVVVDKIIKYETDPKLMGDWRLNLSFVADDEDNSIHFSQCDNIAKETNANYPLYNQNKIYLDAFDQVALAGGDRYPEATEEINRAFFKGNLAMVYLGHGGPTGWAQERVLKVEDIMSWNNTDNLPILITATCSFTGFDDPSIVSAGEHTLLNPGGGVVALLSTSRLVYSSDNFRLTRAVYNRMFEKDMGERPFLGEIFRGAKNGNYADTVFANSRKFFLFGDPAMTLAIPEQYVFTSKINGIDIEEFNDTLSAMQPVEIEGYIGNVEADTLQDFNGTISVTLFDKPIKLKTLGNDPSSSIREFEIQSSTLFKGEATVKSGKFKIAFVLPKDINYEFGFGKLSYYAADTSNLTDAGGHFDSLVIGGTDQTVALDDTPPIVDVFINDTNFIDGGMTGPNPVLFAKISDDNGINITGNNIGHDLMGILDGNTKNAFILNDFFTSEKDDYRSGTVKFPLKKLAEGPHHIQLRAWDIANNLGIGEISFQVVSGESNIIKSLLAYPNPFTDEVNFAFEHNLENGNMSIRLEIFNLHGEKIKEIHSEKPISNYRENDLKWEGDTYAGTTLSPGMYLYKVTIQYFGNNGTQKVLRSDTEKLVYIR